MLSHQDTLLLLFAAVVVMMGVGNLKVQVGEEEEGGSALA
jgi:hypothetical protein